MHASSPVLYQETHGVVQGSTGNSESESKRQYEFPFIIFQCLKGPSPGVLSKLKYLIYPITYFFCVWGPKVSLSSDKDESLQTASSNT